MYLRDLMAGLRRRWYLVIIGVLLSGGLAAYVYSVVPATYEARASLLLLPSEAWTEMIGVDNPYLSLTGMGPALDVLTRRVDADVVRLPIERRFPDTEYRISADATTSGPIVLIETTGPSGELALGVLARVRSEVEDSLVGMQRDLDIPVNSQIDLVDVFVDQKAIIDTSPMLRLSGAAGIGGILLTIILTGLIDGLFVNRRARTGGSHNGMGAFRAEVELIDRPRAQASSQAQAPAPVAEVEPVAVDAPSAAPVRRPESGPQPTNRPTQRARGNAANSKPRGR